MERENEIRTLYGKSEKLTVTGGLNQPWFWREGELSYKQFLSLLIDEKKKYVETLLEMDFSLISTNDQYILNLFMPLNEDGEMKYTNLFKDVDTNKEIEMIVAGTTPSLNDII